MPALRIPAEVRLVVDKAPEQASLERCELCEAFAGVPAPVRTKLAPGIEIFSQGDQASH